MSDFSGIVGVSAQNTDSLKTEERAGRLDFTANIQNNHLWRGLIITDKPVVMGNLSYALDKNKTGKLESGEHRLLPMTVTVPIIKKSITMFSIPIRIFI